MRQRVSARVRVLAVVPLLVSVYLWPNATVGEAAPSTTFSGQATAVQATVLGTRAALADTGPVPSSGGALEKSVLSVSLPNVLSADVAHATTIAQADRSESEAALADLNLTVGGNIVGASFLMSQAKAVCGSVAPSASGSAQISNLSLNGQQIAVSGAKNQHVSLPNGGLTLNEQNADPAAANHAGLTVNALHVVVNGVADVIISSAHADVTCPPPGQPPVCVGDDFMTGSGSITTPSGAKANFALAGAFINGKFWGHLIFIDHGNGKQWRSTALTAYQPGSTPTARHMEGTDDENGRAGTFKDDAEDNGQPGNDRESFQSDDGENDSGQLGEGKMHHHAP